MVQVKKNAVTFYFVIDIKTNWLFKVRFYCVMADTGCRLTLWYHVYGSLWTAKIMQANNLNITREAGLTSREPSISYDVYGLV